MSSLSSVGGTSGALPSSPAISPSSGTSAGSPTGTISVGGLVSGLNTSQIIQGLLAIQQEQITNVQSEQSALTQKETAYKALQAQLVTFQSSVSQLAETTNGPFDGRTATSSNPSAVTAAASSTAAPGVYSFTVNSLAQADEIASQNYASATSPIAQGTYTVSSGSNSAAITINGSNDTLQGLAAAINNAGAGVSATLVNDGSSQPYRLLLTANATGTANAIQVTPPSPSDATTPKFTTTQAAADASITLGSTTGGGSGLTVTNSSNTLNNVINGVTLNLLAATGSSPVQLTIANDNGTAQTAIQNFVSAYNSVISTIAGDTSYDASTNTAGVLLGDSSILNIQNQLTNLVLSPVAGANPNLNSLSALGITSDASGQLQVNSTTLNNVLSGQVSGVTLNDVRNLFAVGGQSTNPGVTFIGSTSATKSSSAPYGVDVTQAAQQATLTGNTALGPYTPIAAPDNTFTLTANGATSNVLTIPPSSGQGYTPQALVAAIQSQINADSKVGGEGVTVGLQNNQLTFTTAGYGQASSLSISAADFLGYTQAQSAAGKDVAGSFLVNGQSEAATGNGQLLTGNAGNANTDGLAVQVTLLPSQVNANNTPEANLTVTQGVAAQLNTTLNSLLNPVTGQLQTIDQNFQDQNTAYQNQINQLQQEYNAQQTQLTTEFTNLETTLSNLKNASGFLSAQTSALETLAGVTSSAPTVGSFSSSSATGG